MKEALRIKDIAEVADYSDKVFLTFDIDWASEEVQLHTVELLERKDLKATFFVTHESPMLDRMAENPNFELGIHPNFNPLLNGDFRYGKNVEEVIDYYHKMVPDAVSVRSHSLVQASQILAAFSERNFHYDCNLHIPMNGGMALKPMKHWIDGMLRIPHFFEDDTNHLYGEDYSVNDFLSAPGLKVFDFHPIHVFLNSENMARYDVAYSDFHNHEALKGHVYNGEGTQTFLEQLINQVR